MKRIPVARCNPCIIEQALRSPHTFHPTEGLEICLQPNCRCHRAAELNQAVLALLPPDMARELREQHQVPAGPLTMSRGAVARVMGTSPTEIRQIEEKFVTRMAFARAERLLAAQA